MKERSMLPSKELDTLRRLSGRGIGCEGVSSVKQVLGVWSPRILTMVITGLKSPVECLES